nr:NtaA/DmoA family FMN-dependent monooxygenase [uncultured Lichenicoccus sp.]
MTGPLIAGPAVPGRLVDADWLAVRLDKPGLVVLDATVPYGLSGPDGALGLERWREGHIPGARYAELAGALSDPAAPFAFAFPPVEDLRQALEALGVGDGTAVLIYDDFLNMWATRIWWMLRAIGFDNAAVLDGGWSAWKAGGHPVQSGPLDPATRGRLSPADLRPSFTGRDAVLAHVAGQPSDEALVCALPTEYFTGAVPVGGRGGHIPGSLNIPASTMLDDQGRFLPESLLRDRLAVLAGKSQVILYCGGGISATILAFALGLIGRDDPLVYDGSLEDWNADPDRPLVALALAAQPGAAKAPARVMHFNGFKQSTVGHAAIGLWRHPDCQAHRYRTIEYWLETARTLEAGGFDSLFVADALGVLDVAGGRIDATLRHGVQTPSTDPLLVVSAMAAVTHHLGFAITVSSTYEQPYSFARKMTTLDHLTGGRIGWNIVTSALESAARSLGLDCQVPHDERYAIANEFLDVTYKAWEASWEDDAVVLDRLGGVFADPAKVHPIAHKGRYFSVPDAFLCEPSPQRTPVLFQAGLSEVGRDFAARHAEGVFVATHRPEIARAIGDDIRSRAVRFGRDPAGLKIFAMMTVVTDATDALARAKYADYARYISPEGHLARLSAILQLDLTALDLDEPLEHVDIEGIRGVLDMYTRLDPGTRWTPRAIAEFLGVGGGGAMIIGGPATAADELERWFEEGGLDGFNLTDPMPLQTYPEFNRFVLPELRRRGRVRRTYDGTTLRENLYGAGRKRLPPDHPGSNYRHPSVTNDRP